MRRKPETLSGDLIGVPAPKGRIRFAGVPAPTKHLSSKQRSRTASTSLPQWRSRTTEDGHAGTPKLPYMAPVLGRKEKLAEHDEHVTESGDCSADRRLFHFFSVATVQIHGPARENTP